MNVWYAELDFHLEIDMNDNNNDDDDFNFIVEMVRTCSCLLPENDENTTNSTTHNNRNCTGRIEATIPNEA
ncbi:hypothetical protein AC249_AIPGENE10144 [Exaiptasia diaphana]|nr:hypothetical protein AC249_AIPGENE10144 [Exaiptasia diaphana]